MTANKHNAVRLFGMWVVYLASPGRVMMMSDRTIEGANKSAERELEAWRKKDEERKLNEDYDKWRYQEAERAENDYSYQHSPYYDGPIEPMGDSEEYMEAWHKVARTDEPVYEEDL